MAVEEERKGESREDRDKKGALRLALVGVGGQRVAQGGSWTAEKSTAEAARGCVIICQVSERALDLERRPTKSNVLSQTHGA